MRERSLLCTYTDTFPAFAPYHSHDGTSLSCKLKCRHPFGPPTQRAQRPQPLTVASIHRAQHTRSVIIRMNSLLYPQTPTLPTHYTTYAPSPPLSPRYPQLRESPGNIDRYRAHIPQKMTNNKTKPCNANPHKKRHRSLPAQCKHEKARRQVYSPKNPPRETGRNSIPVPIHLHTPPRLSLASPSPLLLCSPNTSSSPTTKSKTRTRAHSSSAP